MNSTEPTIPPAFDLERFKQQLAETIAWCAPRAASSDIEPSYPTSVKCSIDNEKNTAMGGVFFIQFKAVMKIKSARQY